MGFQGDTGYGNWRKGIKESGCRSPRVQVGRGGHAGGLACLTGGESRAALGSGMVECASELLDHT